MPANACVYFYEYKGCGTRLKLKPGDCCVFAPMVRSLVRQGKKLVIVFVQTRSAIRSSYTALGDGRTGAVAKSGKVYARQGGRRFSRGTGFYQD
jgi:hypothetical protein